METETDSGAPDMGAIMDEMQTAGVRADGKPAATPPVDKPALDVTPGANGATTATGEAGGRTNKRDMSGIPTEHHQRLERMSQEGFDRYSQMERDVAGGKLIRAEDVEARVASAQLAEHPRGFIASPEFEKASNELADHGEIMGGLERALIDIKKGKNFTLTKRDKDGKLVKSDLYKATPENEVKVQRMLGDASAHAARLEGKLTDIEQQHATAHKSRSRDIESLDTQLFSKFDANPGFSKGVDEALAVLPKSLQHNPARMFLAKNMALNIALMSENAALKAGRNTSAASPGITPSTVVGDGDPVHVRRQAALARNAELAGMAEVN